MSEPTASDQIVVSVRAVGKVYRLYDHPQDRLKHMLFDKLVITAAAIGFDFDSANIDDTCENSRTSRDSSKVN